MKAPLLVKLSGTLKAAEIIEVGAKDQNMALIRSESCTRAPGANMLISYLTDHLRHLAHHPSVRSIAAAPPQLCWASFHQSQYARTLQSLISRASSPDRHRASEQTEETRRRRLEEVLVMIDRGCLTSDCCWRRSRDDGR